MLFHLSWAIDVQYSIIRLSQCSEEERSATGSDRRELMIGTSPVSDLRLHVSFGMPDECLRIRVEQGVCLSENLTGDPGLVFVNGQQVFGIMQLDDGDALQIGSDQFAVVFDKPELEQEGTEHLASVAVQSPTDQGVLPETQEPISAESHTPNAKSTVYRAAEDEHLENQVLTDLCETPNAFLLANFKASHVELPSTQVAEEDLIENLPASICSHNSLHAICRLDSQSRQDLWNQLKGQDAAVWCLPFGDIQSCLLDIKLYAAWFVRPSVLETALQDNPGEFKERILRSFRMLVVQDNTEENRWHLYTRASVDLDHPSHHSLFKDV